MQRKAQYFNTIIKELIANTKTIDTGETDTQSHALQQVMKTTFSSSRMKKIQ